MGLTRRGIENKPVQVFPDAVVVKIASGSDHIVCLTEHGEIFTFGMFFSFCFLKIKIKCLHLN